MFIINLSRRKKTDQKLQLHHLIPNLPKRYACLDWNWIGSHFDDDHRKQKQRICRSQFRFRATYQSLHFGVLCSRRRIIRCPQTSLHRHQVQFISYAFFFDTKIYCLSHLVKKLTSSYRFPIASTRSLVSFYMLSPLLKPLTLFVILKKYVLQHLFDSTSTVQDFKCMSSLIYLLSFDFFIACTSLLFVRYGAATESVRNSLLASNTAQGCTAIHLNLLVIIPYMLIYSLYLHGFAFHLSSAHSGILSIWQQNTAFVQI